MARIHYNGGDCGGQIVDVPDTFRSDSIRCGNTIYDLTLVAQGEWLATVPGATKPHPVEPEFDPLDSGAGDDTRDVRFLEAWSGVLHSIGHNLQGGLHRSMQARKRMKAKR